MDNRVAVFIDFENIKRAVDDQFPHERVDLRRIVEQIQQVAGGRIVIRRAYADWAAFREYRADLLDTATEPVQMFALNYKGKNGADIRVAIDAMDVALRQPDITHVALVSGDSDFTPLVMKLREFGRFVIGVGVRSTTSQYLAKACDHFSYYDDLRDGATATESSPEEQQRDNIAAPMDPVALLALALAQRGNRPVGGSLLKTQMRRIDPSFDEARYGYASFLDFLRTQAGALIDLHRPAIGDVTVAPKGVLSGSDDGTSAEGDGSANGATAPSAAPSLMTADRYHVWLRDNNFRYVPRAERHEVIRVLFAIFRSHEGIEREQADQKTETPYAENPETC
jgi:uncharacterized protein (TIGR00288 family)